MEGLADWYAFWRFMFTAFGVGVLTGIALIVALAYFCGAIKGRWDK